MLVASAMFPFQPKCDFKQGHMYNLCFNLTHRDVTTVIEMENGGICSNVMQLHSQGCEFETTVFQQ